jgi:hypothetical protein
VRHEDIPEINNPKIRFPVLEGDKLMKEVLNGGYNVHPVPPPNSEIIERIKKRYETKRIKIEKLLTLGYTSLMAHFGKDWIGEPTCRCHHNPFIGALRIQETQE